MDGLRTIALGDASILFLDRVTDQIKDALESRLVDYCYGRVLAEEDPDYYSFDLTIEEFFKVYDAKSEEAKIGLAGELIVHLLVEHGHENLASACVYLNKEERNVKKGFDLTFRDRNDGGLWYGEVKAGRVNDKETADSKARSLISTAELGLHEMFTSDIRKKRWDAAILDADAALESAEAKSVKKLLRADFKSLESGTPVKVKALLCAVVMHDFDLSVIDAASGAALIKSVTGRERFGGLRLLLIQQSDLDLLIEVLRNSMAVKA